MNTHFKDTWYLGRQMSHLSVQTKLDGFFNPALLRSKISRTSESSIDQKIYCTLQFLNKGSTVTF
jgi:hypothetical protein